MADQSHEQAPWWQPGLLLFLKLSGWIAGPIVLSLFLGKWLDRRFGTEPWFFLGLTGLAFVVSTFAITYEYARVIKRIENETPPKKDNITNHHNERS